MMTPLRQDALTLLAGMPEEKLAFVVEFLRGVAGGERPPHDAAGAGRAALARLERMIKAVPDLDYDKALAEYREKKYGAASLD